MDVVVVVVVVAVVVQRSTCISQQPTSPSNFTVTCQSNDCICSHKNCNCDLWPR